MICHTWNTTILCVSALLVLGAFEMKAQTLPPFPSELLKKEAPPAAEKIAQGYLYAEPYQARFEVLFDVTRFSKWLGETKELPTELDAARQEALCQKAASVAENWCRLNTGGTLQSGHFIGASIIKGKPAATLPLAEKEAVLTREAMLGLIWEFPTPPAPDQITVEWSGFQDGFETLPLRVFFGSQSEVMEINRGFPRATWKTQGRLPMPRPLAQVPGLSVTPQYPVPVVSVVWGILGLLFYAFVRIRERHLPGGSMPFLFAWILGAVLSWPLLNMQIGGHPEVPAITDKAVAEKIITPLLRNVYRAFDHRVESEIYDVLALSVEGELLRKLYLETISALTLEGREGTRVTISEFSTDVFKVAAAESGPGFLTDCQWTAMGTVGHWGHAHTRVNRYTASVTVSPVGTAWKITDLDVSEARRL